MSQLEALGETILEVDSGWYLPLRNVIGWSFQKLGSGYVVVYRADSESWTETTYTKNEDELKKYLTDHYGHSVATYLMERKLEND